MNAGLAYTIESLFGPPSELIRISDFLDSTIHVSQNSAKDVQAESLEIVEECSVEEIHDSLFNIWSNATLSAHLIKDHDHIVSALHAAVNPKCSKPARKSHLPDPHTLSAEVASLQRSVDDVSLKSFRLNTDSVLFMRTSKNSDSNILTGVKASTSSSVVAGMHEAILVVSIHDRVPWGPSYVSRSSQHAVLSSQTLNDIYECLPCISNNLPPEASMPDDSPGCLICIENLAYGTHMHGKNYSEKLVKHLELLSKKTSCSVTSAPTSMQDTKISSLSLRINEPYWLIHRGSCEHFVVVDQVRLRHPLEPCSGYPFTLQITPAILSLCRACAKVPAVWSIVGDIRLGESPCVLCGPCWRAMGEEEDVLVLPLPEFSYDRGPVNSGSV